MSFLPRNAAKVLLSFAAGSSFALTCFISPATAQNLRGLPSQAPRAFAGYNWLRGFGRLTVNPTSLSFGNVPVGSTKSLYGTVQNTGNASVTISGSSVSGTGFSVSGLNTPLTVPAGQSVTFAVNFAPTAANTVSGKVSITYGWSRISLSLSGSGAAGASLNVSPGSISFGNVNVGATKSATSTITASGSSVTVSSAGTSNSEFTLSGPQLPLTIAAGRSASFTVTFKPQNSGSSSATASFVSNASNSTSTEALSGSGIAVTTTPHSVDLSWVASVSSVSGYNIYRSTRSGSGYVKVNSSLDTATSFTDNTVQSGTTYYYVTTAVNANGESSFSNQVQAVVPNQ